MEVPDEADRARDGRQPGTTRLRRETDPLFGPFRRGVADVQLPAGRGLARPALARCGQTGLAGAGGRAGSGWAGRGGGRGPGEGFSGGGGGWGGGAWAWGRRGGGRSRE